MRVEILEVKDGEIRLKLLKPDETIDLSKSFYKGRYFGYFEPFDNDMVTDLQRSHYYALVGDLSYYTGYPETSWDSMMKYQFMLEEGLDELPSLSRNKMTKVTASKLIDYVITYCIQNEIPFRKQQFYLTTDNSKMILNLTLKRWCCACGKPHADIHHASNLVGIGNNRKIHDHEKSTFMSLCRSCHNEIHVIGYMAFCEKHHVKAVKLSREQLIQLGVMK